jgi:hypothetical protein
MRVVSWNRCTSGLRQSYSGIWPLEFDAGICGGELPVGLRMVLVGLSCHAATSSSSVGLSGIGRPGHLGCMISPTAGNRPAGARRTRRGALVGSWVPLRARTTGDCRTSRTRPPAGPRRSARSCWPARLRPSSAACARATGLPHPLLALLCRANRRTAVAPTTRKQRRYPPSCLLDPGLAFSPATTTALWRQSKPGRELATGPEQRRLRHTRRYRACCDQTDTGGS